jgi:hypothetical protein
MDALDNKQGREEIYSIVVRAGKRTYFFDVKETRAKEKYLTITESKRRFNNDSGKFFYEKHKLFLYKEDFEKFADGLTGVIDYIKANPGPEQQEQEQASESGDPETGSLSNGTEETKRDFTDTSSDDQISPDEDEPDDAAKDEDKF